MSRPTPAPAGLLLLATLCLPAGGAQAAIASPFAAMAGSWSGDGVLSTSDGGQERLRCRASYDVAGTGPELRPNFKGARESYNFYLAGEVQNPDGAISRPWGGTSPNRPGTPLGR